MDALLGGLVDANVEYLMDHPDTPHLYDAGIRYKPEDPKKEEWLLIPDLYKKKVGDCEDLGAALAAFYIVDGYDAEAFAKRTGAKRFHTLVEVEKGDEFFVEDPSRVLGMRSKRWRKSQSQ